MHGTLFTITGTFVKMQIKIYEWKRDFEETQTTWLLLALFTSLCEQAGANMSMFSVCSSRNNISGCEQLCLFCHYTPGWAQFNIPIVAITTGWQQPLCPVFKHTALTQSSTAEVMPGLWARTLCSEQGYEIRSKFRGLLSRLCNNSINQTSCLLPLMFYKRGFSTFYCYVSWITSRLWLIGREFCGVTLRCLTST